MKKIICFALLPCLMLCGCRSYSEIEDNYLVGGIAVDRGENKKYAVTAEVIAMSPEGEGIETKSVLLTGEDDTVTGALISAGSASEKKLYYSQTAAVIISEEVAREGITDIIDLILRDVELRLTEDVVIAKGCRARELLSHTSPGNKIRSFEIHYCLQNEEQNLSVAPEVKVYELVNAVAADSYDATLPYFELPEGEAPLVVGGAAYFKGEKLKGFLDIRESKILTLLLNKTNEGSITVNAPQEGKHICAEIFTARTHKKIEDGRVGIICELETGIDEMTEKEGVISAKEHNEAAKIIGKEISEQAEELIEKFARENLPDIFRIGDEIYRKNPKLWKKIKGRNYLSELKPQVTVKVTLRSSGLINK